MNGAGVTRIDTVIGNGAARSLVTAVDYDWDNSALFDHVPIKVTLALDRFAQTVWREATPAGIRIEGHRFATDPHMTRDQKDKVQSEAASTYLQIWQHVQNSFQQSISRRDVTEANRIWCHVAEIWLFLNQTLVDGTEPGEELLVRRSVPRRGSTLPLVATDLVVPITDGTDSALLGVHADLLQICSKIKGICHKLTIPKTTTAVHITHSAKHSQRDTQQNARRTEVEHLCTQLLHHIIKYSTTEQRRINTNNTTEPTDPHKTTTDTAPVNPDTCDNVNTSPSQTDTTLDSEQATGDNPINNDATDHKLGDLHPYLKILASIMEGDRLRKTTDEDAIRRAMKQLLGQVQVTAANTAKRDAASRRKQFREAVNNPNKGSSGFFKAANNARQRPTSVLRIDGKLTSDLSTIHGAFEKEWQEVYQRLQPAPPNYDEFRRKFGTAIKSTPTGDLRPTAEQLHTTARKARADAAPGRNGWKPAELALLPRIAWEKRKEVLDLIIENGKWPDPYLQVSSPCLRKADKLDPKATADPPGVLDHRLLSVYTQLYRIEMSAWVRNHHDWVKSTIHPDCLGALAGRECG
jgi:hypothetical protein